MEIRDASSLARNAVTEGSGVRRTQLHPTPGTLPGLVAVELWELEPGTSSRLHSHGEEHVLYVLDGTGELHTSEQDGASGTLRPNSVAYLAPNEPHRLKNTGPSSLRVVVSTPLLVRSNRAFAAFSAAEAPEEVSMEPQPSPGVSSRPAEERAATPAAPDPEPQKVREAPVGSTEVEPAQAPADLANLMKKGSDLVGQPRPERRRAPEPEPAAEPEPVEEETPQDAEAEAAGNLMELTVIFDGGSRGNPGEGYGSYMVQAPGRKPVIKRVEFGSNFTNNQAEYESLISALEYIIERLTATGRSPEQVQLQIRSDSDLVVNQLLGTFKVKDANIRKRHERAMALLEQFADWFIEWHARDESVRLLGH